LPQMRPVPLEKTSRLRALLTAFLRRTGKIFLPVSVSGDSSHF
jgi:hypothetical protein